jgi:predicted SAM-dependent methyltransferase
MVQGEPAVGESGAAVKLNLGCADRYVEGWHNVDHEPCPHPRDETVDLTGPLPWPDGSIELVYAGHLLEHLTYEQCRTLLVGLRDLMVPGGQLMAIGPDMALVESLGTGDRHEVDELRHGGHRWQGDEHRWECTTALIEGLLRDADWLEVTDVGIANVALSWPVIDRVPQWQFAVSAVAP